MAWFHWSKTAANNSNADPSISWAAGMSPSSVEPSGRAMMAAGAQWRDDISGTITTGGTLNAYTVATNQVFTTLALMNGAMIAFVPHVTNGAIVTLNVDGLGAKPLRSAPGVELGAGVLVQGTPYPATYNNSDGAFYLQGFFGNPFNIPIGGLMPYLGATAPNANFVLPFGQVISRVTYATLFSLVSTTFGVGDGTTTFGVPDLRDRAIFGLGNMGGSDAGRINVAGGNFDATVLGATGGAQNHTLTAAESAVLAYTVTTIGGTGIVKSPGLVGINAAGGGASVAFNNGDPFIGTVTATATANAGGGAHTVLNPCMALPYILRVI